MKIRSLFCLSALLALSSTASAVPIPGLQNTGVGAPYNPDPVWQITLDATGGGVPRPATIIFPLFGAPPFNWYAGPPVGAGANWIGPNPAADHVPGVAPGNYEYTLQFDLTGLVASTAFFVYESAADNEVISATLNGAGIPFDTRAPGGGNQFNTLSGPLVVLGPFVPGINTLVFDVANLGAPNDSPHGFLFIVDSSAVSVPEPTSLALFSIAGAIGLLAIRRKRLTCR